MLKYKKSCKNGFGMILLPNSIFWRHKPKIVDQSEISATLRASKGQYIMTPQK